ncbi:MAG: GGDEF domain-containing protein [Deltaproteobacteria bacterium]|nr:GGDEF domain-containing protein [Deltaproteobacteria bacterium]
MIGATGLLDHVMGVELRLYPLYVVPVALTAWKLGLAAGLIVALLALAAWAGSHLLAGQNFPAWAWAFNAVAHLLAFAVVVFLVVFLQRSRATERRLARTDPLTGLLNARAFYEIATAELGRQQRYPRPVTLAFVDLDNFKEVNDRYGHTVGDLALLEAANAMRAATRATDTVARLGGDEFALLLPETDVAGARRLLRRLGTGVAEAMAASSWPVSCSIGAVTFDAPPDSVDAIITAADQLMYRVKAAGKNAAHVEPFAAMQLPER